MFDAKANRYPRIKATMSYAIWQRNLFLVAGADDMANYVRAPTGGGGAVRLLRGLQLVFNDEDLRVAAAVRRRRRRRRRIQVATRRRNNPNLPAT